MDTNMWNIVEDLLPSKGINVLVYLGNDIYSVASVNFVKDAQGKNSPRWHIDNSAFMNQLPVYWQYLPGVPADAP